MPGGAALAGKPRRCTCAVDRLPARAVGTNDHKYDRDAYGASHTLAPLGRLALIHDIFGGFVFTSTPGSILVSVEAHLLHLRKSDIECLPQGAGLRIDSDTARPCSVPTKVRDFRIELRAVDGFIDRGLGAILDV